MSSANIGNVRGTFKNPDGTPRVGITIRFRPLNSPIISNDDIVVASDVTAVTDSDGTVGAGTLAVPPIALVEGFYRVIVSETDAFIIQVAGDNPLGIQELKDIAVSIPGFNASSVVNMTVPPAKLLASMESSTTVEHATKGDRHAARSRFTFVGESNDMAGVFTGHLPLLFSSIATSGSELFVFNNNAPSGASGTFAANVLTPFADFVGGDVDTNGLYYVLGPTDWVPGNVNAVTSNLFLPSNERYYRRVSANYDDIEFFVLDTAASEPDGIAVGSTQLNWLQSALAASTKRWKVVVLRDAPQASVDGYTGSTAAYPLASWGAHAVIASNPQIMEHSTFGGIPLFIAGCLRDSGADGAGTPLGSSVFSASVNSPTMLVLDANDYSLKFWYVTSAGNIPYSYELVSSTIGKVTSTLKFSEKEFAADPTLGLIPRTPEFNNVPADALRDFTGANHSGKVLFFSSLPTTEYVRQNPYVKDCLWVVGFDPMYLYLWHRTQHAPCLVCATSQGSTAYHTPQMGKLTAPTFDRGNTSPTAVVGVTSVPSGATLFYSINGTSFTEFAGYDAVSNNLLILGSGKKKVWVSVYVTKAGSRDSDITTVQFETP